MPLKPLDTFPAGGVSSRDNPIVMPPERYLAVRDLWPQMDGSFRLRDGYSLLFEGSEPGVPIHSIVSVIGPGPTYTPLIVFWQGTVPYVYDTVAKTVSSPAIKGKAIQSSARFCYVYVPGKLYAYNGSDAKWFDGIVWRDIGLPKLTNAQVAEVIVSQGLSAITPDEAAAVTLAAVAGGSWAGTQEVLAYLAFFDTANDSLITSSTPLGDGTPTLVNVGQKLNLSNLAVRAPSSIVGLPGIATSALRLLPRYVGMDPGGLVFLLSVSPSSTAAGDNVTVFYNWYPVYPDDATLTDAVNNDGPVFVQITGAVDGGYDFNGLWEITGLGNEVPPGHDTTHWYFTFTFNQIGSYILGRIPGSSYRQTIVTTEFNGASFLKAGANKTASLMTGMGTTVTMTSVAHGLTTGDVIVLYDAVGIAPWHSSGPFTVTVFDSATLLFQSRDAALYDGLTNITFFKLQTIANGATTFTIDPNVLATGQGKSFNARGDNLLPYMNIDATAGIAASAIGGAQPGYQFYASIINTVTQHVGNRALIGNRIPNTSTSLFQIDNLPDLSTVDSEWAILIGRTSDGAELPYALLDTAGNWIVVPNGQTSASITQRNIDGNAELPSRNWPPPGTLDYNAQLAALPGGAAKNPPITGTFKLAWVESDHCCGVLAHSPTIYRSGSAQDMREGQFVGLPEQSWAPNDIETFPTGQPIVAAHGYEGESWVMSRQDSGVLLELSGETQWQGPWNIGAAGQYAWTRGWQNLPYWVTGKKQLATISLGGSTGGGGATAKAGPVPISSEYEAALLAKIGDQYLGEVEVCYIRHPHKLVDVLRIKCRDKDGCPFVVIHDFNLRDERSPYGQAYEERFIGTLTGNCP